MQNLLSEDNIIKVIKHYIKDSIYNTALMIDGAWGSGKTYFVKEKLVPELQVFEQDGGLKRQVIYISLYGIDNVDEISKQIYLQYIEKKMLNKEIPDKAKGILTSTSKIIGGVLNSVLPLNIEFDMVGELFKELIDFNKCILVFDDLERCNCEVSILLGYINGFVEHDGVKVILVANDSEMGKLHIMRNKEFSHMAIALETLVKKPSLFFPTILQDSKSGSNKIQFEAPKGLENSYFNNKVYELQNQMAAYRKIREKLIGQIIRYQPDFFDIFKKMINGYTNGELNKRLIKDIQRFCDYAKFKNHLNLRTVQFFLSKAKDLNNTALSKMEIKEMDYSNLLFYLFQICVAERLGEYKFIWEEQHVFSVNPLRLSNGSSYIVPGYKFIDEFVLSHRIDSGEIKKDLELFHDYQYFNEKNEEKSSLFFSDFEMFEMEQDVLNTKVLNILCWIKNWNCDFKDCIKVIKLFSRIVGYEIGFEEDILEKAILAMDSKNLYSSLEPNELPYIDRIERIGEGKIQALTNKYFDKLEDILNATSRNKKVNDYNKILNNDDWGMKLQNQIQSIRTIEEKSFIGNIDMDLLIEKIKNSTNKDLYHFFRTIQSVYDGYMSPEHVKDLESLKVLSNVIENLENLDSSSIRTRILEWLQNILKTSINNLETVKNNAKKT